LSVNSPAPELYSPAPESTARFGVKVRVRVRLSVMASVSVNDNNSSAGKLADKYPIKFCWQWHPFPLAPRCTNSTNLSPGVCHYTQTDKNFVQKS